MFVRLKEVRGGGRHSEISCVRLLKFERGTMHRLGWVCRRRRELETHDHVMVNMDFGGGGHGIEKCDREGVFV
jgi:hypothetical protein